MTEYIRHSFYSNRKAKVSMVNHAMLGQVLLNKKRPLSANIRVIRGQKN